MMKITNKNTLLRIEMMLPTLNEFQRGRYLATEAKSIGYGGMSLVSRISGISRQTLTEGVKELINPKTELPELGRCRKSGAGRKPVWKEHPE
jgi:hypothetical protein